MSDAIERIEALPIWHGSIAIEPLHGGLSNESYTVADAGRRFVVRLGRDFVNEGGSFTLTTGILADDPVYGTTNAAMVNNAIHGFVIAVSQELKNGLRINVVSPGLVEDSAERLGDHFPGHIPVAMDKVAAGYVRSVEGWRTGEVIRVY